MRVKNVEVVNNLRDDDSKVMAWKMAIRDLYWDKMNLGLQFISLDRIGQGILVIIYF